MADMAAPLARAADDARMNNELMAEQHEEDPMAEYFKKKRQRKQKIGQGSLRFFSLGQTSPGCRSFMLAVPQPSLPLAPSVCRKGGGEVH